MNPEHARPARPADADDEIERVRAALEEEAALDARRIEIARGADVIALRGVVPTPEQTGIAVVVAQGAADVPVRDELQVDENLREGAEDVRDIDPATPAPEEVLVGDVDMLAGPDSHISDDEAYAIQESEPWLPPDTPTLPEPRRSRATPPTEVVASAEAVADSPAAPDLSVTDLTGAGALPSLDPERSALADAPPEEGEGVAGRDELYVEGQVARVPGTRPGPGAIGEHATRGGLDGGTPATETGAVGEDTAAADPARSAGGTARIAGVERGPESEDDPAVRDDFPSSDER